MHEYVRRAKHLHSGQDQNNFSIWGKSMLQSKTQFLLKHGFIEIIKSENLHWGICSKIELFMRLIWSPLPLIGCFIIAVLSDNGTVLVTCFIIKVSVSVTPTGRLSYLGVERSSMRRLKRIGCLPWLDLGWVSSEKSLQQRCAAY